MYLNSSLFHCIYKREITVNLSHNLCFLEEVPPIYGLTCLFVIKSQLRYENQQKLPVQPQKLSIICTQDDLLLELTRHVE